jgi:hypothetical protein
MCSHCDCKFNHNASLEVHLARYKNIHMGAGFKIVMLLAHLRTVETDLNLRIRIQNYTNARIVTQCFKTQVLFATTCLPTSLIEASNLKRRIVPQPSLVLESYNHTEVSIMKSGTTRAQYADMHLRILVTNVDIWQISITCLKFKLVML